MRPWDPAGPPLGGRPIMAQEWRDLVFVHWAVDPERVAPLLPAGVRPDVHDGATYVGLVPFRMVDAGVGRGPAVPWLGTFLEVNVRLYGVDDRGRHGVVFRSLDADRLGVVLGARTVFGTPYRWARIARTVDDEGTRWRVHRRGRSGARTDLAVTVGDTVPQPTDLEVFLTARFGLHTAAFGRTWWVPNTHPAWALRCALLRHLDDDLVAVAGLPGLAVTEPVSVLAADGIHTEFGRPQAL